MPLDIEKYRQYVAGFDLSPQEQAELIRNVWKVLESFVDQAYGRHPLQYRHKDLALKDLQDPLELLESQANDLNGNAVFKPDPLNH